MIALIRVWSKALNKHFELNHFVFEIAPRSESRCTTECRGKVHADVNALTMRPNFRQARVKLKRENSIVASGSGSNHSAGFLAPQPPGLVGAGPEVTL
jgi:hypothetical protein